MKKIINQDETYKAYNVGFNQGWLVACLTCIAGAGFCYLYDFIRYKNK